MSSPVEKLENKILGKITPKKPNIRWDCTVVFIIIIGFFTIFGGWAFLSPLESASLATGKVVVAGYRRVIQHYEGGIVKNIYVKDGSKVKKNQVLIRLDNTQEKVSLDMVLNKYFELIIAASRIESELKMKPNFTFPDSLTPYKNNPITIQIYNSQKSLLLANEEYFHQRINMLKQKISQLIEEKNGEKSQLKSYIKQQEIISQELKEVKILYQKRLIERSKYLNLMRETTKLAGMIGEKKSNIAAIKQKIGETNTQIISIKNQRRKELITDLRETKSELAETKERLKGAKDILNRTIIRSPQSGFIVNMKVNTIGYVTKPGEILMEIVPNKERLVIDSKININDIDVVHPGLTAKVQLTALQMRTTPALLGKIIHISADTYYNEKTGEYYYRATVQINKEELKKLGKYTLYPGMPAEIMIITGKQTPFDYFVQPIKRSFQRAFHEQ